MVFKPLPRSASKNYWLTPVRQRRRVPLRVYCHLAGSRKRLAPFARGACSSRERDTAFPCTSAAILYQRRSIKADALACVVLQEADVLLQHHTKVKAGYLWAANAPATASEGSPPSLPAPYSREKSRIRILIQSVEMAISTLWIPTRR